MLLARLTTVLSCGLLVVSHSAFALSEEYELASVNQLKLFINQDLELLMQQPIQSASGLREEARHAPAAMVVISKKEILERGYDSLDDVITDLPGFDVIKTNGTEYIVAYQRGYRTPWTQRTLLMIDGKAENNIWNHGTQLSRQYPLSMIERIEVLYGPASAVYGANAFLGVINVITKKASALRDGENYSDTRLQAGSFGTTGLDVTVASHETNYAYRLSARFFESDEPDLDDYSTWGFAKEEQLRDPAIWGQAVASGDLNGNGSVDSNEHFNEKPLGQYYDPSENYGLFGELELGHLTLGFSEWKTEEAYGVYYSFKDAQANSNWLHEETQYYIKHENQSNAVNIQTDVTYREDWSGGDWIEAFGTSLSYSDWSSFNSALSINQQYSYPINDNLNVLAGIKYERKTLTKSYITCGYYEGTVCPGEGGFSTGDNVINSQQQDTLPFPVSADKENIPRSNTVNTIDKGGFVQGIWDVGQWRFNMGVRWDNNSIYGSEINPRGAAIYNLSNVTTLKLIYGEAFQEPSPKDLFGSWTGRNANPDLEPEKVRNLEFIALHQTDHVLHDVSLFSAFYENVIAGAENVGDRTIVGLEYRAKFNIVNPFYEALDISGYSYYTFTRAIAEQQYDNVAGAWIEDRDVQGDVAPHKINVGLNVPFSDRWNLNIRGNWVSKRELFSQNPLRADSNSARVDNVEVKSYATVDLNVLYQWQWLTVNAKIENLFEESYLQPGVEEAASGDDFENDADGFQNSLIPAVESRVYTLGVRVEL